MRPALALLPLALVLAACGGAASLDAVASAATKTTKAGGEHADFHADVALPSLGASFTVTGSGDFDNAKHVGRMSVEYSGIPQLAGKGEEILDGTVIYMKLPFLKRQLPAGKEWMKLDLQKAGEAKGIDFSALMQNSNGDPTQVLRYLETAAGDVEKVGTDTVAGTATTRYKAVVDFDKVAQAHPSEKASIRRIEQLTGVKRVPVGVWIDGDGYVRKLTQSMTMRLLQQGTTMRMTLTFDLSDFGKQVAVTPPPAEQVFDATSLAQAAS
jgi:hypothetical protein